jgi:hypothetical protein
MKKMTPKQIEKKYEALKTQRSNWETHWQEVADLIVPRKNTIINSREPGEKRTFQILDNTAMHSCELLAGAFHSLLTNPDGFWFEFTTGDLRLDQNDLVRRYFQDAVRSIHNVLNNSNFQTEVHELYIDIAGFGTANMLVEEDKTAVVRFSTKFIKDYCIEENSLGVVDEIYRKWKWKAQHIVEEFGITGLPKKVVDAYEKAETTEFDVIHAVYPKKLLDPKFQGDMQYISQYILPEMEHELEQGQFKTFPYVTPRFSKASGEKYGRSPAMTALPEAKILNKMNETMLIGAQKLVDPPIQMPDDGFVLPVITRPGGINYYRTGTSDVIKPIFNDTRIDFGYQAMEDRRQRIKDAFYVDQLKLSQDQKYMTATEVLQRTEQSMRLLGPLLGRMQSEFLRPLIDRVFQIMFDRNMLPPAPPQLEGRKIDVRYSSLIAKSQRMADAQNVMRTIEAVSPFLQLDPTVADNFNGDNAVRVIAQTFGFPQEILRDAKEIAGIRQQRQEQQAAMQRAMQEQQAVENSKTVTETMVKAQGV